jgi:glycine betaine/proline transport system substrate-binding protein
MWQAVATGDVDGITTAWLPVTHGHYLDKVGDKVVDLGPNCEGAAIGLVVPAYVTIDSIEELNAHAAKFDNEIIGIDPGAGIMSKTEKAVEEYGLDLKLMEGTGAMMTAILADRIKNNEWAVVTGWTPHWKFARWDLKYLEDPKNVYGGEEKIHTFVRRVSKRTTPKPTGSSTTSTGISRRSGRSWVGTPRVRIRPIPRSAGSRRTPIA